MFGIVTEHTVFPPNNNNAIFLFGNNESKGKKKNTCQQSRKHERNKTIYFPQKNFIYWYGFWIFSGVSPKKHSFQPYSSLIFSIIAVVDTDGVRGK